MRVAPHVAGLLSSQEYPRHMVVAGVRLKDFRNHADSHIEFGPGVTALLGDNGQGKTSVLEAVSFLSLTKSFYASADVQAVRMGTPGFEVDGNMINGGGSGSRVSVRYVRDAAEKRYEINGNRPEKLSAAVGQFPVVVLSPENSGVTGGGPGDRRKFIDLVLSQVSTTYLEVLLEYRRTVRQRNRLLLDSRLLGSIDQEKMQPWDESLAKLGGAITERRHVFLHEFREFVLDAYRSVAGGTETPDIHYVCSVFPADGGAQEISRVLTEQLVRRRTEEIRRGSTLVGPHRDDIGLLLNGIPVQQYASQGQHKTMLVALKVAEHRYLAEQRKEQPILLLDDVFSELDRRRCERILNLIAGLGQVIVTATDERVFQTSIEWNDYNRRYIVDRGTCTRVREA